MRIDARTANYYGWSVYHAEECRFLRNVVWVDSDTAQWGEAPLQLIDEDFIETRQAKKIAIYMDRKLVIINPVPDEITIKEKELEAP